MLGFLSVLRSTFKDLEKDALLVRVEPVFVNVMPIAALPAPIDGGISALEELLGKLSSECTRINSLFTVEHFKAFVSTATTSLSAADGARLTDFLSPRTVFSTTTLSAILDRLLTVQAHFRLLSPKKALSASDIGQIIQVIDGLRSIEIYSLNGTEEGLAALEKIIADLQSIASFADPVSGGINRSISLFDLEQNLVRAELFSAMLSKMPLPVVNAAVRDIEAFKSFCGRARRALMAAEHLDDVFSTGWRELSLQEARSLQTSLLQSKGADLRSVVSTLSRFGLIGDRKKLSDGLLGVLRTKQSFAKVMESPFYSLLEGDVPLDQLEDTIFNLIDEINQNDAFRRYFTAVADSPSVPVEDDFVVRMRASIKSLPDGIDRGLSIETVMTAAKESHFWLTTAHALMRDVFSTHAISLEVVREQCAHVSAYLDEIGLVLKSSAISSANIDWLVDAFHYTVSELARGGGSSDFDLKSISDHLFEADRHMTYVLPFLFVKFDETRVNRLRVKGLRQGLKSVDEPVVAPEAVDTSVVVKLPQIERSEPAKVALEVPAATTETPSFEWGWEEINVMPITQAAKSAHVH